MPSHDDTTPRPLAGIKVLDLSRALSGPFCTMTLGDLGATVIKAEPSLGGDMTRGWGPFAAGQSVYYMSANRSKQSLAIDFRHPRAVGVLRRLARASHVLIENFRPGVADEMGLDYATLSADNPALVYASISGFGSTGPARDHPGFDQIAQGHAGLMSLTGDVSPTRVGVAIGDMTAGLWTALGIVAALRTSEATGRGERIETSLTARLKRPMARSTLHRPPKPCGIACANRWRSLS
jgi:crotonobetainyl-CoA:carnitine CoA-transferase CaiB-like acyl-CoA transferase